MRKILAASSVVALAAVGLTGCSLPGTAGDCPRPAASAPATDLITVSGPVDNVPDVSVYAPFHTQATAFRDVETGTGTPIRSDEQLAVLDVTLVSGETGDLIVSTPYDGNYSSPIPLTQWTASFPGFEDALECAAEGTRVAVALAPGDIEERTAQGLGIGEDDSAVAVIDVRKVYLPHAEGGLRFNAGNGVPSVVRAPDGRPGIIVPDGDAPEDLVVQTLIEGDGEEVTGDVPVRVHYTGVTWADREVFDSTWDSAPASLTLDGVVPGFAQALEGQRVGSQVMVVIPPELGYGDAEQGAIPAGSTLVFVIDILGLDEPAA
ncbi:FKBP-type peptidyl-prolyl cis-trans isomerase [Microbacterium aureliae]